MKHPHPSETVRPDRREAYSRRQEEILEKASTLFARHGYTATDTQFLADELQIGKGTLYRYFVNKEELFLAAVDFVMRKFNERVEATLAGISDPLEQIRKGIRTYLEFFAENPQFVDLLLQERALFQGRRKPTFFAYRERNILRWQAIYRDLIAKGLARDLTPEQITNVIADLLYGTMFANCISGREPNPEAQARDILEVAFRGVLTDAGWQSMAACGAASKNLSEQQQENNSA